MNKFFKWLVQIPAEPVPQAKAAVKAQSPILQPTSQEQLWYARWRAGHIQRWLDDPANAAELYGGDDSQQRKIDHLIAERDMYRAMLRVAGED